MARRVQGIRSAKYRAIETLTHQTRGNVVPAGGKPNIQRCCGADERSDIRGGFASGTALPDFLHPRAARQIRRPLSKKQLRLK